MEVLVFKYVLLIEVNVMHCGYG
ncbi:hypothetical protein NC651_024686 [Populus alba x Populus x berolinensis]|nr:hypothetical protein NC651_024686 [Populus alba x Populus x berolinensis]